MQGDDSQRYTRSVDAANDYDRYDGDYPSSVARVENFIRGLMQDSDIRQVINETDVQELTIAKVSKLLI